MRVERLLWKGGKREKRKEKGGKGVRRRQMEHTYLGDGWVMGKGDGVGNLSVQAGGQDPWWCDARKGGEGVEASAVL